MNDIYYLFLLLFVCGLLTRNVYEVLKKSGRVDLKSKTLFAFIFTAMCVLWISWFTMCPMDPQRFSLPDIWRWMSLGAYVAGMVLCIGAVIQLRGLENINHLVTAGLFSRVRHPMYTGFMLWIVGWGCFHGATISLAVGLLAIGSILYWRNLEDNALESRYGEVYRVYRARTWF
jgi:protein-S-isoprenylcysteine O-methyltransferase Ste14